MLAYVAVLVVLLVGVAVILQVVTLSDAAAYIGRALAAFVFTVIALCVLKAILLQTLPSLISAFAALRRMVGWLLAVVVLSGLIFLFGTVRKPSE